MSTEHHKPGPAEIRIPLHEDVSFEPRDVQVSIILKFLAYMGVAIVFSFFLSFGVYRGLIHFWKSSYTEPPPSRAQMGPMIPPEPRLQGMPGHFTDPQHDLRNPCHGVSPNLMSRCRKGWRDSYNSELGYAM